MIIREALIQTGGSSSPDKAHLKAELQEVEHEAKARYNALYAEAQMNDQHLRGEAQQALSHQEHKFERAAQEYQVVARDIVQTELAQE